MNKWVKYILIVIAIIAIFAIAKVAGKFVFKTGNEITKNVFGDDPEDKIEKALISAASTLRKQLPLKLDEFTTLNTVVAGKRSLHYGYGLSFKEHDLGNGLGKFKSQLIRQITNNACNHKDMTATLKNGVSFHYTYFDSNGALVFKHQVQQKDCL